VRKTHFSVRRGEIVDDGEGILGADVGELDTCFPSRISRCDGGRRDSGRALGVASRSRVEDIANDVW